MLTGLAILAATLAPQPQLSVFVHQARHLSGGHLTVARVWLESKLQYFDTDERPDPTAVKVSHPRINVDGKGAAPSGTGYVRRAVAPVVKQAAARGPVFDQAPGSEHLGHLSAYFILGAMVFTGYGRRKPGGAILALCLFAAATEALQSFVITRDAEWLDLMFNGMGLFVGVLTGYFALKISAAWLQIHSRSAIP